MADIGTIRGAIQTRLETTLSGVGLHVYSEWPDQIVPPAVLVAIAPLGVEYEQTLGATDRMLLHFNLVVLASLQGGLVNAQAAIDPWLSNTGASSIRVALAADRTLNGGVHGLHVRRVRDYGGVQINSQEWLGATIDLDVHAS